MAKLRKFCAYRRLDSRAYTRRSKYRKKNFIRASPHSKIVRFDMGDPKPAYQYVLKLQVKDGIQIRNNAFESARQTSNRVLETELGKNGYCMKMNTYPHHIIRENPLASGAGADRMSTGMKMSFGKPIGTVSRLKKDQTIATIKVNKNGIAAGRKALKRFQYKIPCKCSVVIEEVTA